jgi:hypothetical protein
MEEEGKVIEALPQEALKGGLGGVKVLVIGRDADGTETGRYQSDADLITQQWVQFLYTNFFYTTAGLNVVTITGATVTGTTFGVFGTLSALTIAAGIGTNAAQVNDNKLQTISGTLAGTCPGTISAWAGQSGVTGSFTITGTITNTSGSTINYSEIGLMANDKSANTYLLTHDVFTAVPVSYTGTLTITYTITNS